MAIRRHFFYMLLCVYYFDIQRAESNLDSDLDDPYFIQEPKDIVAVEGGNARLTCTIESLPLQDVIEWRQDGDIELIWNYSLILTELEMDEKCRFCYPPDGDISIGVYDLMIRNVSWRTEGNSLFECQIPRFEKRSNAARITVLVPPRYVEITPTSETGVIVLRRGENVALTCTSGYTSPSVAISWFIDDIWYSRNISLSTENIKGNGGRMSLSKTVSTIYVSSLGSNVTVWNNTVEARRYNFSIDARRVRKMRQNLKSEYNFVQNVICEITAPIQGYLPIKKSVWVVSAPSVDATKTTGLTKEARALYIAVGSATAVLFAGLYVGCVILRRAKKTEESNNTEETFIRSSISHSPNNSTLHSENRTSSSYRVHDLPRESPDVSTNLAQFGSLRSHDKAAEYLSKNAHFFSSYQQSTEKSAASTHSEHIRLQDLRSDSWPRNRNNCMLTSAIHMGDSTVSGNLVRHSVCEPIYHNFEGDDWDNLPLPPLDMLSESGELPPLPPAMSPLEKATFSSVLPPGDTYSTLPSYEPDYNVVSQPPKFSTFQRRSVCETSRISPNCLSDPECDWKGAKSPTLSSLV